MNRPSETIRFYDEHADDYVANTVSVNMEAIYSPFLYLLKPGAKILDAGCGSGRDTKAFLNRGFQVTAIDASPRMIEATTTLTGKHALRMRFEEIDFDDEFDGIWACASLLHVPRRELSGVLRRFGDSLRDGGVCYMSFKEGDGDRIVGERRFTDFTESPLKSCLAEQSWLRVLRVWVTSDVRLDRDDRWVNALVSKARAEISETEKMS